MSYLRLFIAIFFLSAFSNSALGDYEYAAKVVCGESEGSLVQRGRYSTAVNVHNPAYEEVQIQYKFATADLAMDGSISKFREGSIGPDGAQYFNCEYFRDLSNPASSLLDGFFVIQSKGPLDVRSYYTGGAGDELSSLDVEKVSEREIPDIDCQPFQLDLGNPSNMINLWNASATMSTAVISNWANTVGWIQVVPAQSNSSYTFDLPYCVCAGATSDVAVADFKTDNSGSLRLDGNIVSQRTGNPGSNYNNSGVPAPGNLSTPPAATDQLHLLRVEISNQRGPSGFGLDGNLSSTAGYLGNCEEN